MMRLYHSVLWVLILSLVLLQIQYSGHTLLSRSSTKDLRGCYDEALSQRYAGSYIKLGLEASSGWLSGEIPANLPGQFSLSGQIFLHWAAATLKGLGEFQNKKF